MKIRKYKPGRKIRSMTSLLREIDAGRYVYLRHKAQHPGWVVSMQLRPLRWFLAHGWIRRAVLVKK